MLKPGSITRDFAITNLLHTDRFDCRKYGGRWVDSFVGVPRIKLGSKIDEDMRDVVRIRYIGLEKGSQYNMG